MLHKVCFHNLDAAFQALISAVKQQIGSRNSDFLTWVNFKTDVGFTALHYASYRGNLSIIIQLIELGAQILATTERGMNVMHVAAQGDQPGSLVYFKQIHNLSVMSVDKTGSTVLHWACYSGSESAINYILSWEPNLNETDNEGLTPLHLAVVSGIYLKRKAESR